MSDSFGKVRELHAAVRDWLERSVVLQKNEHLRANLPCTDLMFAFAFATIGDPATAHKLIEGARKVLEVPIPDGENPRAWQALTAALVSNFLFKAFKYRVDQALAGKSHSGPQSGEVLDERERIVRTGGAGPVNSPHKLAVYVIDRFREQSRIVEPQESPDPYADWTKHGDRLKRELAALHDIREPVLLVERIRNLYRDGISDKPLEEVRFDVLHEGLPLAPRVGETFVMEMLALVPAALEAATGAANESPALPKKQGELLERALFLAGHYNRPDVVRSLVNHFVAVVRSKAEVVRFKLINVVTRQCLRSLTRLGLTNEIDRFLTQLQGEVLSGASLNDLRKMYAARPEQWGAALQTLLNIAGGWLSFGLAERAKPIVEEARRELLPPNASVLQPKDFTELARAYVAALGSGQAESGFRAMIELFSNLDPRKISNTWTTAQFYSRFHLNLVEDAVLALCRLCCNDAPSPFVVQ